MSGHSKWAQIKHKKSLTDVKRGQVFGKLAKNIQLAARRGGDPSANPELRTAVEKAKAANMPADNIERAIKKGSGQSGGATLEPVRYEAYGPGGVAIIIDAITDNNNRTVAEIKHILSLHNAKLATAGSVTWAFEKTEDGWKARMPQAISEKDAEAFDKLMEALDNHDDVQEVYSNVE